MPLRVSCSHVGTTSACAENTDVCLDTARHGRNYLRVRGEYTMKIPIGVKPKELPPRARRIPPPQAHSQTPIGTTSACAENTLEFP